MQRETTGRWLSVVLVLVGVAVTVAAWIIVGRMLDTTRDDAAGGRPAVELVSG